jgi:DNA-binding transcriptional ArsR family regulator
MCSSEQAQPFKQIQLLKGELLIFVTNWLHNKHMRRDVFQAIADPTRREIINIVVKNSINLNAVAEKFNISRPAISKHIRILTECGLISIRQKGRERYCEANLGALGDVAQWIDQYRVFWNKKLDALENFLNADTATVNQHRSAKKLKK